MEKIIPLLRYSTKQRLTRRLKKCREAKLRTRYLIIINLDAGRSPTQTAAVLHVSRTTIYRVAERGCRTWVAVTPVSEKTESPSATENQVL